MAFGVSKRKQSKSPAKKIVLEGVEYPSISVAAKKYGISHIIYGRLRKGWTIEEAFGLKIRKSSRGVHRKLTIDGIDYPSRSEAARAFNLNPGLVNSRLNAGWSPEEAVELVVRKNGEPNAYGIVYLITNRINGKKYVGVTMSTLEKRWTQHIKQSNSGHYTKNSLQAAIAAFGPENFDKKMIDSAKCQSELTFKEISWINKERTQHPKGYNLTRGGGGIDTKGEAITVEGVEYPSIVKAAEAFNLPYSLVIGRLNTSNWSVEEAFEIIEKIYKGMSKKIEIDGGIYPNLKTAAEEYGICYKKISSRLNKGWSLEEAFELKDKDHCAKPIEITINNKRYFSIAEAARELGVNQAVVRYRLKAGWTTEEAFNLKKRTVDRPSQKNGKPLTVQGIQYPNITKAAQAYKMDYSLIYDRLSKGWSVEEAFNLVGRNYRHSSSKEITVKGKSFPTIKEAALYFGLDPALIYSRINKLGWSVEEAFNLVGRNYRHSSSKEITVKGKSFPTIKEAALYFGLDPALIYSRIKSNWSIEKAFEVS